LRFIGLDVHRDFCDVAIYENGKVRSADRVASSPDQLQLFAQSLWQEDHVTLETTGNALSIARILEPHVGGVLVADTRNVRAMTHAKVKSDRFDAQLLAKLLAAGMLPGTWVCDEQTRMLRRRLARRARCPALRPARVSLAVFPLTGPLPSTASAPDCSGLFGGFAGTTGPSDFPRSFIGGVPPKRSPRGPHRNLPDWANMGPPGSRAWRFRACTGSSTTQGPAATRDNATTDLAFRACRPRRRPDASVFEAQ
jgi:hypothetical protein